ncbi:MAG: hypothetical protein R3D62_03565 [Xanthobacteraceae bacterium]
MIQNQDIQSQPQPIVTAAQAWDAITALDAVIAALEDIIAQEEALVRAGRLVEVARIAPRKDELARRYLAQTQRLKGALPRLRDELGPRLAAVKARHADFRARLQLNITVLATAHAVSEGIVRGLSQELTRKAAPQVYGASGRTTAAHPNHAAPLAVSRSL